MRLSTVEWKSKRQEKLFMRTARPMSCLSTFVWAVIDRIRPCSNEKRGDDGSSRMRWKWQEALIFETRPPNSQDLWALAHIISL